MPRSILTLNAGSSSLKFALFDQAGLACIARGAVDGLGTDPRLTIRDGQGVKRVDEALAGARHVADQAAALGTILAALRTLAPGTGIAAVGHRVVHGGAHFEGPAVVDAAVMTRIRDLVALAPLHQPHNIAGIEAATAAFPQAGQVACFDTAFHRGHAFVHDAYALPRALYDEGIRRYGFHGLSYEYIAGRLAEIAPDIARGRVVVCHLGSGASMCALSTGRSVASSMGFTALDGLPMGTRPGSVDPGVLLHLLLAKGMEASALSRLLYHESGLKGLSGISNDMRALETSTDPPAAEAINYFVARIVEGIGAMAAMLDGLDAIVFTAGIGENSPMVRERVLARLSWLGVELDRARNAASETILTSDGSQVRGLVVPTDEELMIARHTAAAMAGP